MPILIKHPLSALPSSIISIVPQPIICCKVSAKKLTADFNSSFAFFSYNILYEVFPSVASVIPFFSFAISCFALLSEYVGALDKSSAFRFSWTLNEQPAILPKTIEPREIAAIILLNIIIVLCCDSLIWLIQINYFSDSFPIISDTILSISDCFCSISYTSLNCVLARSRLCSE